MSVDREERRHGNDEHCSCSKVFMRMECEQCGYPFSEAAVADDGRACDCDVHVKPIHGENK